MKIKDILKEDRPRERLINLGVEYLSNEELIAIIFNTGYKKASAKELAINILSLVGDVSSLNLLTLNEMIKQKGIGYKKAATLIAALELGKRVNNKVRILNNIKFDNPKVVFEYYQNELKDKKQEYFYCIYLNNQKVIINDKLLFVGTINMSIVHPREIFKEAYALSASYIICVHNHPSGDYKPSNEDIELTSRIKEIGHLLGIKLIDHIIIGYDYYSFYENDFI
jgi:DNA repair protein RadC